MRSIKYIIIHDCGGKRGAAKYDADNLRYHYVINSQGAVLHPIDITQPAKLKPETWNLERRALLDLNNHSIAIKFTGALTPGTKRLKRSETGLRPLKPETGLRPMKPETSAPATLALRAMLVGLLLNLRSNYPDAVILAKKEYGRYHSNIHEDMNALRRELSNLP